MTPKIHKRNIGVATRHPRLIGLFLKGYDCVELEREHFLIHLRQISKIETNVNKSNSIELTRQAIDLCSNSCYGIEYLYLVCRHICPNIVVETGVAIGFSSFAILKALEYNRGRLYSIDLPNIKYQRDNGRIHSDTIPQGSKPGPIIPESLKVSWELVLGDSKEKLPRLLESIGEIDIFHHDSMHTYDLMTFEYETVWPYLKHDGLLLSHDVHWSKAFEDFCHRHAANHRIHRNIGIAQKLGT